MGVTVVPQLEKLPLKKLRDVESAVQVLEECGFLQIESVPDLHEKLHYKIEESSKRQLGNSPPANMLTEATNVMKGIQRTAPQKWSMRLKTFLAVLEHCTRTAAFREIQDKKGSTYVNMYEIADKLVVPWTAGHGCGLSLMMSGDEARDATLMLSHAWAEDIVECLGTLRQMAASRGYDFDATWVWFCVFANYQPGDGAGPSIEDQLRLDPFGSVIHSASVRQGQGMVAVHTSKQDLYARLWCTYEVAEATKAHVPVAAAISETYTAHLVKEMQFYVDLGCDDRESLHAAGVSSQTAASKCGNRHDQAMIATEILRNHGSFAELDKVIQEFRLANLPVQVSELRSTAFLRRLYASESHIREEAQRQLPDLRAAPGFVASLLQVLCGDVELPHQACQQDAARLLSEVAQREDERTAVSAALLQILKKAEDGSLRKVAAQCLGEVALKGDTPAADALILAMRTDKNVDARRAAAVSLGAIAEAGGKAAVTSLMLTMKEDDSRLVRVDAAKVLGELAAEGDEDVTAALICAMREDRKEVVRICGAQCLSKLAGRRDQAAESALIQTLVEDASIRVRESAAQCLLDLALRDATACAALTRCLKEDPEASVRAVAADYLGQVAQCSANSEATSALTCAMRQDANDRVRGKAAAALCRVAGTDLGDQGLSTAFMHALAEDKHEEVRAKAAIGLGKIAALGDTQATAALVRAMREDSYDSVRVKAAGSLRAVAAKGDTEAAEACGTALIEDRNRGVRKFAKGSLRKMAKQGDKKAAALLREAGEAKDFWSRRFAEKGVTGAADATDAVESETDGEEEH